MSNLQSSNPSSKPNVNEVYISDVYYTGHNVSGEPVSAVGINRGVKEYGIHDTRKILDRLSELVEDALEKSENELKDGIDISLLKTGASKDSISNNKVNYQWSEANNPLWIIKGNFQIIDVINAGEQPLGKYTD